MGNGNPLTPFLIYYLDKPANGFKPLSIKTTPCNERYNVNILQLN